MRIAPFLLLIMLPTVSFAQGELGMDGEDARAQDVKKAHGNYNATVLRQAGGDFLNAADDAAYNYLYKPGREVARNVGGFFSDVIDGSAKRMAVANGDAVSVNANAYLLTLRKEERENQELNKTASALEEQSRVYKKSEKEVERLKSLAEEYKVNAKEFQQNLGGAVKDLAETTQKIEGLSAAQKDQIAGFLKAHQELGKETAKSGDPKYLDHFAVSMSEMLSTLGTAVKGSQLGAQKKTLEGRIERMRDYMQSAATKFKQKELEITDATEKVNSSRSQLAKLSTDEQQLRREQVLSSLNNSVVGIINNAEFSKIRSQLAFAHFDDIAKELKDKGLNSKDVKKAYKERLSDITKQYNETPIGLYVNGQISKAMGSVCDLVANQCKDAADNKFFDFMDDSSRKSLKPTLETEIRTEKAAEGKER